MVDGATNVQTGPDAGMPTDLIANIGAPEPLPIAPPSPPLLILASDDAALCFDDGCVDPEDPE
jgi:hypothetical protein